MTYNVFGGTLNLARPINQPKLSTFIQLSFRVCVGFVFADSHLEAFCFGRCERERVFMCL